MINLDTVQKEKTITETALGEWAKRLEEAQSIVRRAQEEIGVVIRQIDMRNGDLSRLNWVIEQLSEPLLPPPPDTILPPPKQTPDAAPAQVEATTKRH